MGNVTHSNVGIVKGWKEKLRSRGCQATTVTKVFFINVQRMCNYTIAYIKTEIPDVCIIILVQSDQLQKVSKENRHFVFMISKAKL